MKSSLHSNDEYTIGWISALNDEFMVAMAMLDEEHGRPQSTPRDDTNAYHLGQIGDHKVAMACLAGGQMGTGPAAVVAENMRRTFKNIRFALLVGIGGGVPSQKKDIRLGDVVISYPHGTYTGVVQYDYGRLMSDGNIQRKDWFSAPPRKVLTAVDLLRAYHGRPKNPMSDMLNIIDDLGKDYAYPDKIEALDRLYQAEYDHIPEAEDCKSCDIKALVSRKPRESPSKPCLHYGIIASGNMVVKNGIERERIDRRYENSILCFEMEAAGLMNNFPCLVIRGISDYCDSHKNDQWRHRAIAVASAYAKELLSQIAPSDMEVLPPIAARALDSVSRGLAKIDDGVVENTNLLERAEAERTKLLHIRFERWLKPPNTREIQQDQIRKRVPGTCDWIWSNKKFLDWKSAVSPSAEERIICIDGLPGCGKSFLASSITDRMSKNNVSALFFTFSSVHISNQKSNGLIRSLLWQLVKIAPQERGLSAISNLMLDGQPTTADLWMAFSEIAEFVSEPVYCIIDGVDEGMDPVSELLWRLQNFLQSCSNFRFILLGRQHAFHGINLVCHRLEITPTLTKDDIYKVIQAEINQSDVLSDTEEREKALRHLQDRSSGNFLWVRLISGHLNKSLPLEHGLQRLDQLPRDLETLYEELLLRLVKRLGAEELDLSQKVFAFTIVSRRPLSLNELRHLLAADAMSSCKRGRQSIEDCLIPQISRRIPELCGDLISIENNHLQLVHLSFEEFLLRPESQWHRRARKIKKFRVFRDDAHRWLATACMAYLGGCYYGSPFNDWSSHPELEFRNHFLRYSSLYMLSHLYRSGTPSNLFLDRIHEFLKSDRWIACLETILMNSIEDENFLSFSEEVISLISWLGKYQNKMLSTGLTSLKAAHEKQAQVYGQTDSRTERSRLLVSIFEENFVASAVPTQSPRVDQAADASKSLQPIIQMARENAPLCRHLKVDLYLKMMTSFKKVRQLTDPMQIFFRTILQYASSMPLYALVMVADFYNDIGKHEQALEFYVAAQRKVGDKERRVKYLILQQTGSVYVKLGQYEQALERFKYALVGQERILGPEHNDTIDTLLLIGLAYFKLEQFWDSFDFLTRALRGQEKLFGLEHEKTLHMQMLARNTQALAESSHRLQQSQKAYEMRKEKIEEIKKACEMLKEEIEEIKKACEMSKEEIRKASEMAMAKGQKAYEMAMKEIERESETTIEEHGAASKLSSTQLKDLGAIERSTPALLDEERIELEVQTELGETRIDSQ